MSLHAERERLTTALEDAGLTVYDHVPERLVPPAVIVTPGSPYLASGDVYGTFRVALTASVVAATATNATATQALDNLVETAVVAAVSEGFDLENASTFYAFTSGTASYLAADISLADTIRFDN